MTKKECENRIAAKPDNVCPYCGLGIKAVRVMPEDDQDEMYVPGCSHNLNEFNITFGVPKDVFLLAQKLVLSGHFHNYLYHGYRKICFQDTIELKKRWIRYQTAYVADMLIVIEQQKNKPPESIETYLMNWDKV